MSQNQVVTLANISHNQPIVCEYGSGHFRLNKKGLWFTGTDKDGNQLPPRWICSPLYVVAKTRDVIVK